MKLSQWIAPCLWFDDQAEKAITRLTRSQGINNMSIELCLHAKFRSKSANGKPVERQGRKVTGLRDSSYDSGIAR